MGWLPSIFGGDASNPLGKLDPKLREFLEKESPVKYIPNQRAASTQRQDAGAAAERKPEPAAVPSASLYQDGRYAHLWKNYRPLAEVEEETSTDHDKLMSVLEGYKERKAAIARAGLENCAPQQEEWINCMKSGSWEDQLQMCRHQVRRFERCYTMQSRFLRALGYGSVAGRPGEVDEDIQLHADALFQRMLQHEAEVEKAKENGTLIPTFDPSLPKTTATTASTIKPSDELQKQWKEKLDQLPEDERAAEEAALRADLQAKADVAANVKKIWDAKREEREVRRAEGQATFSDTIAALFSRGK
ncbi:hypothetical protein N5P37_004928 [Trichoderma harzianum]|uniref:Autophagy-related protein 6 n=2 Tax=Trichoderma TaxID=5543 RepID=A0A2T4ADJ8_TRIHA|nr:hypothetical protein M431DRAFT_16982 [Trichoderma harzianum CBS 226.95]KAK0762126.1 hypothetical protein N5P37_004928 [Trichoderma harzianum]PKK46027.1 hypothetical protein CI102_9669 [Trichoderma harzianum]PTB55160.1 hypothetical protein M431DRAFT_16982 [Trichoderma harzianum CBS 226.95]QYS97067.1 hypothetical protein H0G86_004303 [Trichoderma simmonsii]